MDISVAASLEMMTSVNEFTLEVAADRKANYDTLFHKGRRVAEVEARILEAQFRLTDGSTLLMLNEDEEFKEMLTLLLVSPALKVVDEFRLGGAFTPGFLTYAYPISEDEVAFCWHDLDQVVRVRHHRPSLSFRKRWLSVREAQILLPISPRAPFPKLKRLLPTAPRLKNLLPRKWLPRR